MDDQSFPRQFLIEFNGKFVAKPAPADHDSFDKRIHATVGDRADAAIFEFSDGYLRQGLVEKPMYFGRFHIEPRYYGPMPVYWVEEQQTVQQCMFEGDMDSPMTLKSGGFPFGCEENQVRASPEQMGSKSKLKLHWL